MGGGCSCNVCYTEGKGRERSVLLTLLSTILVLVCWPVIGFFKPSDFPYPLTITMVVHLIIVILGMVFYGLECCWRGFRCCMSAEDQEDIDATEGGEEAYAGPLTVKLFAKRLLNWGAFSGMFMTIFIYSSSVTSETCSMNPNYCTILFRSVLWFTVVVALAVIKSDRRGGRIDWAVAIILSIGISLLLWNHSMPFVIRFYDEVDILIGGLLAIISFIGFLLTNRRSVIASPILQTVWVNSVFGFITMIGLSSYFEGVVPWQALSFQGGDIFKILIIIGVGFVWTFSISIALAYSETILVALALQFALLFGDMGIHSYIFEGFTWRGTATIGLILCAVGFLWLLKRLTFLHCPDVVGKYCSFAAVSNEYPDEEMESTTVKNYGKYEPPQYEKKKSIAQQMGEGYLNKNRQTTYGGTSQSDAPKKGYW